MANEAVVPDGKERRRGIVVWALRLVLGGVFLLSALTKLAGIDQFELYVYSYGFFSLNTCYLLSRLCIAAELVVALATWLGAWKRAVRLATLLLLIFFSLFLCYAALMGRDESCQCFGQLVDMNPGQSLLKNALLLLLVMGYYRMVPYEGGSKVVRIVAVVGGVLLVAVPFVVSVPDNWLFGSHEEPYGREVLAEAVSDGGALAAMEVGNGRRLVAFVTPQCPYCKLARQKLDAMAKRHGIESCKVVYVEPADIGERRFVEITFGARPLMMLMDGGRVVRTYHLRNVDEDEVVEFLSGESACGDR
ncbi:MAG: thioredoxin family protein [Bacteroidales bacterium]|nr:thioredoxin family protein [Bacteroidales bacterium]